MTPSLSLSASHRSPSLLLIALLHLVLLYVFLKSQPQPEKVAYTSSGPAITWLRATSPPPSKSALQTTAKPLFKPVDKPLPISSIPSEQQANTPAPTTLEETPAPAPSRAADILAQAKRDIGKIDKDLRKEFPQQAGIKLEDTAFKRMQQGFADAYSAVPPKWHEASRIEEIGADLAKGIRVYRITSALGSLCVTMRAGKNGESEISNCPR